MPLANNVAEMEPVIDQAQRRALVEFGVDRMGRFAQGRIHVARCEQHKHRRACCCAGLARADGVHVSP